MLARLWQLQNKMESVGGQPAAVAGSGAYGARIERVALARANIEDRYGNWYGCETVICRTSSVLLRLPGSFLGLLQQDYPLVLAV